MAAANGSALEQGRAIAAHQLAWQPTSSLLLRVRRQSCVANRGET